MTDDQYMTAVVTDRYGGAEVPRIAERPIPRPNRREVLVRVAVSSVSRTDAATMMGKPRAARLVTGLVRPKVTVLGLDFAGHVAGLGDWVGGFAIGDAVFGLSPTRYGGHAQYLTIPADGPIARVPSALAVTDAPICEGAWYGWSILEALNLPAGADVMVYGGTGAIGSATVQLARARGLRVVAVAGTPHLDLMRDLGAAQAVGYETGAHLALDQRFDAVIDTVGKTTYFACRHLLKPGGTFAATDLGPWAQVPLMSLWSAVTRSRRDMMPLPRPAAGVPGMLAALVDKGAYRPLIDSRTPLAEIAAAYRHVLTGTKTGVVILDIP